MKMIFRLKKRNFFVFVFRQEGEADEGDRKPSGGVRHSRGDE